MSDSPAAFRSKTREMFAQAGLRADEIVRTWLTLVAHELLTVTPGPGNQDPADTLYIATGRLRASWQWSVADPPAEATRMKGGPYDISVDGAETAGRLAAELAGLPISSALHLWSDVAYGYLVHEGLGRHRQPRPFVQIAEARAYGLLAEAVAA